MAAFEGYHAVGIWMIIYSYRILKYHGKTRGENYQDGGAVFSFS